MPFLDPFDPALHPIHVVLPADPADPRRPLPDIPGVVVHRSPPLHSEDLTTVRGIPCTSVARTLCDMAEELDRPALRQLFLTARRQGRLDLEAVERSFARLEWRPSHPTLRSVIDELSR